MAELFQKDRTVVGRHINNIFNEGELERNVVCAKIAYTTPHGAIKGKEQVKETVLYNLDVIISVSYRVKSQRGTQFRIWANRILKDYLVKGYVINNKVAIQRNDELKQLVHALGRTVQNQEIQQGDEAMALVNVVSDYAYALDTLDRYDYQQLDIEQTSTENKFWETYENALHTIIQLKEKFGDSSLFGNEKDGSFKSSIGQI